MHLEDNCTTQDTCAYIVYIANEVELTGRCEIFYMAPVKYVRCIFVSYSAETK